LENLDESTGINRGEKFRDIKVSAKKSHYKQKDVNVCRAKEVTNEN